VHLITLLGCDFQADRLCEARFVFYKNELIVRTANLEDFEECQEFLVSQHQNAN